MAQDFCLFGTAADSSEAISEVGISRLEIGPSAGGDAEGRARCTKVYLHAHLLLVTDSPARAPYVVTDNNEHLAISRPLH